jgi:hypothetical protein
VVRATQFGVLKREGSLRLSFPANLMEYKENHQRLNSEAGRCGGCHRQIRTARRKQIALILSTAINRVLLPIKTEKLAETSKCPPQRKAPDIQWLCPGQLYRADYTDPSIVYFTTMVMSNFGQSRNGGFLI